VSLTCLEPEIMAVCQTNTRKCFGIFIWRWLYLRLILIWECYFTENSGSGRNQFVRSATQRRSCFSISIISLSDLNKDVEPLPIPYLLFLISWPKVSFLRPPLLSRFLRIMRATDGLYNVCYFYMS